MKTLHNKTALISVNFFFRILYNELKERIGCQSFTCVAVYNAFCLHYEKEF